MKTNYLSSKTSIFDWSDITVSENKLRIYQARQIHFDMDTPFTYIPPIHLHARYMHFNFILARPPNKSLSSPVLSAGRFLPLICEKLNTVIHNLLQQAGCNQSHYTLHSFRIGAATTAATVGLPSWLIQKLGRWSSHIINSKSLPAQTPLINQHGMRINSKAVNDTQQYWLMLARTPAYDCKFHRSQLLYTML